MGVRQERETVSEVGGCLLAFFHSLGGKRGLAIRGADGRQRVESSHTGASYLTYLNCPLQTI